MRKGLFEHNDKGKRQATATLTDNWGNEHMKNLNKTALRLTVLLTCLLCVGCTLSSGHYACDSTTAEQRKEYHDACVAEGKISSYCKGIAEWLYCDHVSELPKEVVTNE